MTLIYCFVLFTGVQTRNVSCAKTLDFEVVSDDLCDPQLQPPVNRTCATNACSPEYTIDQFCFFPPIEIYQICFFLMFKRWFIGNWTKCSSNCQAGVQHRTVYCQQVVSDSKQSVADDEICINSNGPKPSASQPCNEDAVCPTFHIGNWGPVKIIKLLTKFISLIFVKFDFEISATNCAEKGNVVEK